MKLNNYALSDIFMGALLMATLCVMCFVMNANNSILIINPHKLLPVCWQISGYINFPPDALPMRYTCSRTWIQRCSFFSCNNRQHNIRPLNVSRLSTLRLSLCRSTAKTEMSSFRPNTLSQKPAIKCSACGFTFINSASRRQW